MPRRIYYYTLFLIQFQFEKDLILQYYITRNEQHNERFDFDFGKKILNIKIISSDKSEWERVSKKYSG